jgi:hypothetical protein
VPRLDLRIGTAEIALGGSAVARGANVRPPLERWGGLLLLLELLLGRPARLRRRALRLRLRSNALFGRWLDLLLLVLLLLLILVGLIWVARGLGEHGRRGKAGPKDEAECHEALCGLHAGRGFLVERHEGHSGPGIGLHGTAFT